MHFRIVLHLFKTDWQRLKRPVIGLWIIIALTAIPWLLHSPTDFDAPSWYFGGGDSLLINKHPELRGLRPLREVLIHLVLIGSVGALVLAAALGMNAGTLMASSPVGTNDRALAKMAALFAFLIAPQSVCMIACLALQGFAPHIIAHGVLVHGLTSMLLFGMSALFGAWCRSIWLFFAGVAALAGTHAIVGVMVQRTSEDWKWIYELALWNPLAGPRTWIFLAISLFLLALLLPIARRGMKAPVRLTLSVALIIIPLVSTSGLPRYYHPEPALRDDEGKPFDPKLIRPVVSEMAWGDTGGSLDSMDARVSQVNLRARLKTEGCPPDRFVWWQPSGTGKIIQGKRTIATFQPEALDKKKNRGPFQPSSTPDKLAAIIDALPGRSRPLPGNFLPEMGVQDNFGLGGFPSSADPIELSRRDSILEMTFTGVMYRYERILDVPLTDTTTTVKDGNSTYQVRRFASKIPGILADLTITHPSLGFASSPDSIQWSIAPTQPCRLFFHFPRNGVNLPVMSQYFQNGPMLGGAGWHRVILGSGGRDGKLNVEGVRLVIVKPVALGQLPEIGIRVPIAARKSDHVDHLVTDFTSTRNYGMDDRVYLEKHLPHRPDPATCDRQAFGRWLRIPAMVGHSSHVTTWDLACYAPRFSDVLARVAFQDTVAEAIRLGTPESEKPRILAVLNDLPKPGPLLEVVARRGWTNDAAAIIRERFLRGNLERTGLEAVLELEDPATYPKLIAGLLEDPDLKLFEKIRSLPGIEPALGKALEQAFSNTDQARLVALVAARDRKSIFGVNTLAAKTGNRAAFAHVLGICQEASRQKETFYNLRGLDDLQHLIPSPPLPRGNNYAAMDFLSGKSAADFEFDPLSRMWQPARNH